MTRRTIVCLLGPDGSGKSTVSLLAADELVRRGQPARRVWFLEGESSLIRRALRAFGGKGASSNPSQGSRGRVSLARHLYARIVLADYLRFGLIQTRFRRGTIIIDRYHFDVLHAIAREFQFSDASHRRWLKAFRTLLPTPDLTIIFQVSPEEMYRRKPDEFGQPAVARKKWAEFQQVRESAHREFPRTLEVDAQRPIEKVLGDVLAAITETLPLRKPT